MKMDNLMLPEDIMLDIFLRFPIKEMSRLRCVCKSWNNLITSPFFVEGHLSRSSRNPRELFFRCGPDPSYLSFYSSTDRNFENMETPPFRTQLSDLEILGSCNGVLCFNSSLDRSLIYLWNPSTTKFISLPKRSFIPRYLGFGVASMSGHPDDLKVVSILSNGSAEVYSMRTDSWKHLEHSFSPHIEISSNLISYPVFINGSVHWSARFSCYHNSKCPWLIVSFDFTKEDFNTIMLPDEMANNDHPKIINVMNKNLCVFASIATPYYGYELWMMKEYGMVDSWSKLFKIEKGNACFWPLGFTKKGKIYVKGGCEHGDLSLLTYDPDKKRFKCMGTHSSGYTMQVLPFMESLVSPSFGTVEKKKQPKNPWITSHLDLNC